MSSGAREQTSRNGPLDETVRAKPPRPAALGRAALEKSEQRKQYLTDRASLEQRSVLRGLIVLAVVVLLVGFSHAGLGRVFFPGWWRHW